MIRKLQFLLLLVLSLIGTTLVAQVTGTVTSDDGQPLIGVNVIVKGTSTGTITDYDGKYSVDASEGQTLVFSYIGFGDFESLVGSSNMLDITMEEGTNLNEVVVTALGISREKKSLGYATSTISSDDIATSGGSNLISALQGKVAGVQINQTSGTPGGGTDILIRGLTSLDPSRSNRPLYIIDGVEMNDDTDVLPTGPSVGSNAVSSRTQGAVSNRASDINPEDIESMTVLKGAQATALYGIRAANGAIIITTKKGVAGKPKVDIHYGTGWGSVNKTPSIQRDFIDGHRNTTKQRSFLWDTWGAKVFENEADPTFDLYNDFFQDEKLSSYGASVSAGNEKATFRISGDMLNHEGIIPNTDFSKLNFSLRSTVKLTDKLDLDAGFRYTNSGGIKPHEGDKSILSTLSYMTTVADPSVYDEPYVFNQNFAVGIIDHPLFLAENNTYEDDVHRYISNVSAGYMINDHLKLKYTVGIDNVSDTRTRVVHPETDEGSKVSGFIVEQNLNTKVITSNASLLWNYKVSEDIKLTGVVGQSIFAKSTKWISTRGETFAEPGFFNLYNTTNLFQSNALNKYRTLGAFAEVTTSYKDYLYLSVTGRNDWSSTLPKDNNSYFFPSVSLSWVISDMVTMPSFISLAKVRASYAVVGKDANIYRIARNFSSASNFPFGATNGFALSTRIGDEELNPEFTKSFEVGAELSLFNNRLGFDISYYENNITDMILSVPLSNASGGSRYYTNAGEIKTKGLEIFATGKPVKTKNFEWNTSINWSTNGGDVVDIQEGIDDIELYSSRGITNKYVKGGKLGDIYGYAYQRTDDGDLVISEDGFPGVVWDSLALVGNAFPEWTAGWTNEFSYKGLSMSMLWEWKKGGDVFDLGRRNAIRNGQLAETARRHEQVVFEGVVLEYDDEGNITGEHANTTPVELTGRYFYRSSTKYNYAADVLLEDASWIKLRNISVKYDLPKSLFNKMFLEGASITLTGKNLFLDTGFQGYDPELNYFGSGSNIYGYTGLRNPLTRSYHVKVNINF